ncbi:MAG: type II toxin-antitoxin system RelE/ParE family toxin [Bacteroidia bacterium]
MKREVVLAPGVELELREILEYLEESGGKSSAKRFMAAFVQKIELISSFPYIYPPTDRFEGGRKCVIMNKSILYYRVPNEGLIQVISIRDGRSSRV